MRVVAVELPARHGDAGAQLRALDRALGALDPGPPTLAVLPELALTGYVSPRGDFDVSRFAEGLDGPLIARAASIAVAHRVALLTSFVERDGERCFNSVVLLDERGVPALHYRKRHPWFPETWATPGDLGTPVATLYDRRITVAVCFDVHFVSAEAGAALDAVDAVLFPSAWVDDDERDLRGELLPALAARHGCAVVNANWGDGSPAVLGQGGSRIVRGDGVTIARAPSHRGPHLVTAMLPERSPLPPAACAVKRLRS